MKSRLNASFCPKCYKQPRTGLTGTLTAYLGSANAGYANEENALFYTSEF